MKEEGRERMGGGGGGVLGKLFSFIVKGSCISLPIPQIVENIKLDYIYKIFLPITIILFLFIK